MFIIIGLVAGAGVYKVYRVWRRRGQEPVASPAGRPCVGLNGSLVEPRK